MIRVLIDRHLIANAEPIAREAFRELRHEAIKNRVTSRERRFATKAIRITIL